MDLIEPPSNASDNYNKNANQIKRIMQLQKQIIIFGAKKDLA